MNSLLILPIALPLATAAVLLLTMRWLRVQRVLGVAGPAVLTVIAIILFVVVWRDGVQMTAAGNWPPPFSIVFVADVLSAVMVLLTSLMGLAVAVYSVTTIDERRMSFGYFPLLNILLMGLCGAFLTGDLFNLYVWFEVMLMASFVLLALGGEQRQLEGATKYVLLNLFSSTVLLVAIGALYATTGTLNMADLSLALQDSNQDVATVIAVLFIVAFGIKAAVFPVYFWLPASYHTPPPAVSAIFAGLLTKVGAYGFLRLFTLLFVGEVDYTHNLILIIAALTMASGVLGAISQFELRRLLSFQVIAAIGFILMGLGLFTPLAIAGAVFYMVQDSVLKTNLFLISGFTEHVTGSDRLAGFGGVYRRFGFMALLFFIPALSLAGIPPLPGFFAKLTLVQAGLREEQYAIVAVALVVSTLTLLSMAQVGVAFWRPPTAPNDGAGGDGTLTLSRVRLWGMLGPIAVLSFATLAMGFAAEPVFAVSERAADELMNPTAYIEAVLGRGP